MAKYSPDFPEALQAAVDAAINRDATDAEVAALIDRACLSEMLEQRDGWLVKLMVAGVPESWMQEFRRQCNRIIDRGRAEIGEICERH